MGSFESGLNLGIVFQDVLEGDVSSREWLMHRGEAMVVGYRYCFPHSHQPFLLLPSLRIQIQMI